LSIYVNIRLSVPEDGLFKLKHAGKYWATIKEIDTFNVILKRNY